MQNVKMCTSTVTSSDPDNYVFDSISTQCIRSEALYCDVMCVTLTATPVALRRITQCGVSRRFQEQRSIRMLHRRIA